MLNGVGSVYGAPFLDYFLTLDSGTGCVTLIYANVHAVSRIFKVATCACYFEMKLHNNVARELSLPSEIHELLRFLLFSDFDVGDSRVKKRKEVIFYNIKQNWTFTLNIFITVQFFR